MIKSVALKRQKSEKVKYAFRVAMCVAILKLMKSRTKIVLVTICCRDRTVYVFIYMVSSDPVDTRVPPLLVKEAISRIIWLFQPRKDKRLPVISLKASSCQCLACIHFKSFNCNLWVTLSPKKITRLHYKAPSPPELLGSMLDDYSLTRRTLKVAPYSFNNT